MEKKGESETEASFSSFSERLFVNYVTINLGNFLFRGENSILFSRSSITPCNTILRLGFYTDMISTVLLYFGPIGFPLGPESCNLKNTLLVSKARLNLCCGTIFLPISLLTE